MIQKVYTCPDIYVIRVELPDNPLQYLNSYVIKGKNQTLVIDTGFNRPACQASLCAGLQELQIDLQQTSLFLTHLHADHTGLVGLFADKGCPIYMNGIDYQYLCDSEDGSTWRFTEENFMREGMPEADIKMQFSNQARTYSPKINFPIHAVTDGERLHLADTELQVIHTPGHTKGQCCLYLPSQQIFFTADHILFDITPNIQVWPNMKDALEQYLTSLDKVRDLPVRLALPGHRKGSHEIVQRIAAIKEHHARRLQEIQTIVAAHPGYTAFQIAPYMTWSMRGKTWDEFPPTQKWFAMGETLAHLEYLLHHGQLKKKVIFDVVHYYIAK